MPDAHKSPPPPLASPTSARGYRVLGNLVLALAIVGYPLAAGVSTFLNLEDNTLSIGFRVTHSGLCLLLLLWTLARGTFRLDLVIAVFLALYATRLLIDLNYSMWPDIADDALFFAVTVLIPTLAIAGGRDWFDERMRS
jgi:uncharacterized membrane protein SpoIIM required for sporulation